MDVESTTEVIDGETPAGIVGAQFFGGNKQKEEFYDEWEERNAGASLLQQPLSESTTSLSESSSPLSSSFCRFENRKAFTTDQVALVASSLQSQINSILYKEDSTTTTTTKTTTKTPWMIEYTKTQTLNWVTPLPITTTPKTTPWDELRSALNFYKHVDLAIVSGQQQQQQQQPNTQKDKTIVMELQWELSVAWPTFWEPRVLLLGSSTLTISTNLQDDRDGDENKMIITQQVDKIMGNTNNNNDAPSSGDFNAISSIVPQIIPRFWDLYHVGMTPSAELSPRILQLGSYGSKQKSYQVYDLPSRWMVQPTRLETGTRLDGNAQIIPNHAFSSIIITMGPTRQRYVPTVGTIVQILSNNNKAVPTLQWQIPMSVEYQSQLTWTIPFPDEEAAPNSNPQCEYVFQPRKRVAMVSYGGEAQDVDIGQVRKQLYEQVIMDGLHKPKLDDNGRPVFFFSSGTTKACYTRQGGLGMCVYEWQPTWVKANQVGLELEIPGETTMLTTTPTTLNIK